jgi:hypothetical protein
VTRGSWLKSDVSTMSEAQDAPGEMQDLSAKCMAQPQACLELRYAADKAEVGVESCGSQS